MRVWDYVDTLLDSERRLADALLALADHHPTEPDIAEAGTLLAYWSEQHIRILTEQTGRPAPAPQMADAAPSDPLAEPLGQGWALLRELHQAWLLAQEVHLRWTVLGQAARVLRERSLAATCARLGGETDRQLAWLRTRIEAAAPQALVVPMPRPL